METTRKSKLTDPQIRPINPHQPRPLRPRIPLPPPHIHHANPRRNRRLHRPQQQPQRHQPLISPQRTDRPDAQREMKDRFENEEQVQPRGCWGGGDEEAIMVGGNVEVADGEGEAGAEGGRVVAG